MKNSDQIIRAILQNSSRPAPKKTWAKLSSKLQGKSFLRVEWFRFTGYTFAVIGIITTVYFTGTNVLRLKEKDKNAGKTTYTFAQEPGSSGKNPKPIQKSESSIKRETIIPAGKKPEKRDSRGEEKINKEIFPDNDKEAVKSQPSTLKVSPVYYEEALNDAFIAIASTEKTFFIKKLSPLKVSSLENEKMASEIISSEANGPLSGFTKERSGIFLGAGYYYYYSSILNQNTYGEFNTSELNYLKTYGQAYGVQGKYFFNRRFGLEVCWFIKSSQGQHYKDVILRNVIEREVNLDYMRISILLNFRKIYFARLGGVSISRSYHIGIDNGIFRSATLVVNGTERKIDERFKKHDLAAVLGAEYSFHFNRSLHLDIGIRAAISALDINDSNWKVNDAYGKSHNLYFGPFVRLNYRLR